MNREQQRKLDQRLLNYVRGDLLKKGDSFSSWAKKHRCNAAMVRLLIKGHSRSKRLEDALVKTLGYAPWDLDVDQLPEHAASGPEEAA